MSYNNKFGTYPHVFASYRGHVKWVDIDIHAKGWVSGTDEEPMRWTIYEGADLSKEYAEECKSVALQVWKAIGAVDGGRVDLKADRNGRICFMEVNPLAGLHPIHSDLPILSRLNGIEYQPLMEMIMKAALKRHNLTI